MLDMSNISKYLTDKEIDILKKYYPSMGGDVQKYIPRKTKKQLIAAAHLRGLKREGHYWTKQEFQLLRNIYRSRRKDNKSKAELLKSRSADCISRKAQELKLAAVYNPWAAAEIKLLKKYYELGKHRQKLKKQLLKKHSLHTIWVMARTLKLAKKRKPK